MIAYVMINYDHRAPSLPLSTIQDDTLRFSFVPFLARRINNADNLDNEKVFSCIIPVWIQQNQLFSSFISFVCKAFSQSYIFIGPIRLNFLKEPTKSIVLLLKIPTTIPTWTKEYCKPMPTTIPTTKPLS